MFNYIFVVEIHQILSTPFSYENIFYELACLSQGTQTEMNTFYFTIYRFECCQVP